MFYSRRIGINEGQLTPVYGGARLTGKLNAKTDIGFLSMQTASLRDESENEIRGSENFSTLRLRRKFYNQQSFIGLMATNRWVENKINTGIGLDMLLNPSGDHYIIAAVANTFDKENPVLFEASRINLKYELRKTDGLFGQMSYTYSGREFNPGSGFLDRSDFHSIKARLNFGKFADNEKAKFQYIWWQIFDLDAFRGATNNLLESIELESSIQLNTFSGLEQNLEFTYNYEYLPSPLTFSEKTTVEAGNYNFGQVSYEYLEPRAKTFRNSINLAAGSFFGGQRVNFSYNPIWNLGKHWEIQGQYSMNHLRFGQNRETIHIGRLRLNYALNLHLSVNYVVQLNSINRQVFNNFRLRYNFNDGHDLFLVWNENFYTDRSTSWGELRPISGNQNFILKYNVTLDVLKRKGKAS
jgi:hypothetical protein